MFQTVQGLVGNYGQLLGKKLSCPSCVALVTLPPGVRWLLGVFEAGLFPGVNYYLSWCVSMAYHASNSPLVQLVQTV